jgi:hypothetical protein
MAGQTVGVAAPVRDRTAAGPLDPALLGIRAAPAVTGMLPGSDPTSIDKFCDDF